MTQNKLTVFDLVPHVGAGEVHLGMSRSEVRRLLDAPVMSYQKIPDAVLTDRYFADLQVAYDRADRVEYIELNGPGDVDAVFHGRSLLFLPADAAAKPETVDLDWCETQLIELVAALEAADSGQRWPLVSGIFEQLEAEALLDNTIRVVAIPREAWRPFFEGLVLERETGFEPATSTLARSRSTK
jgi:hypothetical protein